jgi:iron complex transport system ATP-binding protein
MIDFRNLTVIRGDRPGLQNFSLSIAEGEHVAILGPNGAGKSTLIKTITRELYPLHEEGATARLFGQELWNIWELRSRFGIVSPELSRVESQSRGQAMRALIDEALAHHPGTLLFDEPTVSLDLYAQAQLRDRMRALAQQGIGILLVTHHLADIIPEINRVVLLKDGLGVGDGPKAEMLTSARLSALFDITVEVHERDGQFYAF